MSSQDTSRLRADEKKRQADMAAHLNVCFRALDELGQSFENANRTRDFLVSLQRRWQNHMRNKSINSKRSLESPAGFGQTALENGTSAASAIATAPTDPSSPSNSGQKKLRISQSSILEDAGLGGTNSLDARGLLQSNVDFGQLGGGLNWAPSSRDLKMMSEEFGDAPLFSTPSSSSTTSPRAPLSGAGGTTMATGANGGNNTIPSLDEISSTWWNLPGSDHRSDANI